MWWERHGGAVLLTLGFLAVGGLSFTSGLLVGRERQADPIVIEKASEPCAALPSGNDVANVSIPAPKESNINSSNTSDISQSSVNSATTDCAYVGSKNSDKYHLLKCSWAKRIKPENRVCFSSAADAEAKGYKPGCVE